MGCLHISTMKWVASCIGSSPEVRLAGAGLSFGCLFHLTKFPLIFSWGYIKELLWSLAELLRSSVTWVMSDLLSKVWADLEHIWYLPHHKRCPYWTSVKLWVQKLDVTSSTLFSFSLYVFLLMCSIAIKSVTSHVYTL